MPFEWMISPSSVCSAKNKNSWYYIQRSSTIYNNCNFVKENYRSQHSIIEASIFFDCKCFLLSMQSLHFAPLANQNATFFYMNLNACHNSILLMTHSVCTFAKSHSNWATYKNGTWLRPFDLLIFRAFWLAEHICHSNIISIECKIV